MIYPTLDEVEAADQFTLCKWIRFLPGPGAWAVSKDRDTFEKALKDEVPIMNRIVERSKELGGFTPEISKQLGWN